MITLLSCQAGFGQGEGILFEDMSWEEVKTKARSEDKLIFLDAYATWCVPCKQMDAQVFSRQDVGSYFNDHFINFKMDLEKGIGPILAARYGVQKYPTLLFLTSDETLVHQSSGYHNAPKLITQGRVANEPQRITSALDQRYQDGDRKPDFLYDLTYKRYRLMDGSHKMIVEDYLDTQKNWKTKENLKFIFDFTEDFNSSLFPFLAENREAFYTAIPQSQVDHAIQIMVHTQIYNQPQPLDIQNVRAIYDRAYPDKADWMFFEYQSEQYLATENYADYASALVSFWKKYPCKDPQKLFFEAKQFNDWFTDQQHQLHAISFMKLAIELDPQPRYYLFLSELYQESGDKKLAKKSLKKYKRALRKTGLSCLSNPIFPIQTPILNCFSQVLDSYVIGLLKISSGPGDFQDSVISPC